MDGTTTKRALCRINSDANQAQPSVSPPASSSRSSIRSDAATRGSEAFVAKRRGA